MVPVYRFGARPVPVVVDPQVPKTIPGVVGAVVEVLIRTVRVPNITIGIGDRTETTIARAAVIINRVAVVTFFPA